MSPETTVDRTALAIPTVGGVRVTDASAAAGGVCWTLAATAGGLSAIERALALAVLVLVPLGAGMVATPPFGSRAGQLFAAAVVAQPVAAGLLVGSLLVESGPLAAALAAPWVGVTGLLAAAALLRISDREPWPLGEARAAETVLDAGLAYPTVASVALVMFHLDIVFWFERVIILLTAVHFHYAGFVLPVATGLAGRTLDAEDRLYRVLAAVVVGGPALIAVGISFSPLVEFVSVGGFTVAVATLGVYVVGRVVPGRPRRQALLVGASALALPVSMALALGYGVGAYTGNPVLGLDIGTMVALHGSLNALGFGLLGVVGWRLAVPSRPGTNTEDTAPSREGR